MNAHHTPSEDVVITGIGLVLPGANDVTELAAAAAQGRTAITPIDRFDTTGHASTAAGVVDDEQLAVLPTRLRKRMDRFCALSMVAAGRAMNAAGLVDPGTGTIVPDLDAERTGVYLGNMFAGWGITEQSVRRLSEVGYTGVSPHIAAAWFPTAGQGQISIHWGLRGFSKTVVADTASGALAVGQAAAAIEDGRADVMLAGGAEAPVTPYTSTFCSTSGRTSATGYRPFRPDADGYQVGEGSVVFVLESRTHATARGATILARVAGFATGHAPASEVFGPGGAATLTRLTREALRRAGIAATELDYIGLDAQGLPDADTAECESMRELLGARHDDVVRATVKPVTGHLLGAAANVELAAAVHTLSSTDARAALVNARGADGTVASCVLHAAA